MNCKYTIKEIQAWQRYYDAPNPHTSYEVADRFGVPARVVRYHLDTRGPKEAQIRSDTPQQEAHAKRRKRIKKAAFLRFEGEMSVKEIAGRLDVTPSSVYSYLQSYRRGEYAVSDLRESPCVPHMYR